MSKKAVKKKGTTTGQKSPAKASGLFHSIMQASVKNNPKPVKKKDKK